MRQPQIGDIFIVKPGQQLSIHPYIVNPSEITLIERTLDELRTPTFRRSTYFWTISYNGNEFKIREDILLHRCQLVSYLKEDGTRKDLRCML